MYSWELSVKRLNDSVKKCLEKEKSSAYGSEWQLLKGNQKKKKERFLAKMFNYRLIKTGHAICWLGCCPHLWGVPRDWLAMCEREPSPMASVICQPPNWNDEQSCHRLSMGHMEWWANEQTMSQKQGFSQANQPLTGPSSPGWSQRLTLCKERWRIRVIDTR